MKSHDLVRVKHMIEAVDEAVSFVRVRTEAKSPAGTWTRPLEIADRNHAFLPIAVHISGFTLGPIHKTGPFGDIYS